MKKIFTSLLLVSTMYLYAQKGALSGKINDSEKISLPGAKITLSPGNYFTFSEADGSFVFLDVPYGQYTMRVDYMGYGRREYKVSVDGKQGQSQDFIFDIGGKTIQEVVVAGDRFKGQARALNIQKNNVNITNVISADQVGRFPDANVGDALKRVPGITMQNDQGEARDIIIRGLAPELNSVTLNGNRIPSAEGDNRRVQMDLIPSDMIQLIEVNKTLTSDMDADAIGGSVNLVTRTAPSKERISFTTSANYNPIRGRFGATDSFIYGNRFLGGKLGWVVNASYNLNDYGSDNVEALWSRDPYGNVYVNQLDIRKYDVKRERKSIGSTLDFKLNENNKIRLNAMYNWRDDKENRYRLRYNNVTPVYDADNNIINYRGSLRAQTKGGISSTPNNNTRLERQTVQNYSMNGEHIIGSSVELDWTVSYARADEQRPNERYMEYQVGNVLFNNSYQSEEQPLYTPVSAPAVQNYRFRRLSEELRNTYEEETTGQFNVRMPLSIIEGQKGRLRAGGKARLKTKQRMNNFFEYTPTSGDYANLGMIDPVYWGGENYHPSSKYVPGYFASANLLGSFDLENQGAFTRRDLPSEYLSINYSAKEDIYAGYLRWDQSFNDRVHLTMGLRVENTRIVYTGNVVEGNDELEGSRTIENSYTNYLPSISLKYNVHSNLVLRTAYSTSIARPNYYALSPFVSFIPGEDGLITAGNPGLKASYAHNFDFMGEYYFKSVGILSFGAFYKNINNFIYTYRDQQYNAAKFSADFPDIINNLDPNKNDYIFTQSRNGESVSVYGLEAALQRQLDFLPGSFLSKFGIFVNYTFTRSTAKGIYSDNGDLRTGITLPGTAPHMFNASLSWENKKFSARLSLNYAAAYLDELGGDSFSDRYYDQQKFLDFNVSYAITKAIRVFGEANNLTNQPLRYYQGISSRVMKMEYYMPRYNVGFKFDF